MKCDKVSIVFKNRMLILKWTSHRRQNYGAVYVSLPSALEIVQYDESTIQDYVKNRLYLWCTLVAVLLLVIVRYVHKYMLEYICIYEEELNSWMLTHWFTTYYIDLTLSQCANKITMRHTIIRVRYHKIS